jgi:hypothetical protein
MDTEDLTGCACSYDERCIQGTWTCAELKKALSKGYEMVKVQEVYNYPETSQYDKEKGIHGIFSEFIDFFLKYDNRNFTIFIFHMTLFIKFSLSSI